jgi:phosphoglycerate dehydrogenase-like enzyme
MMNIRLAPTRRKACARLLIVVLATAFVGAAMYLANGAPSLRRKVRQNEIARFAPTVGHGLFQLFGETLLVVGAAVVARRVVKVRL